MKRFLFVLLVFFSELFSAAGAKEINFIQVTDVHLTQKNVYALKNFVDEVNNNYSNLDFVVFTGDNIDRANRDDLDLFLNTIKNLKFKTYITAGNHDLFKSNNMTSGYYMKRTQKILGIYHSAKLDYVFKKGNIIFIAMNGVKEIMPGSNGYFKNAELVWLDKQLTKYKNNKVIILQHFPLLDTRTKSANLYKKENYLNILSKHDNVIAVVSGHYHYNREEKTGKIYHIITPKFSNGTCYKIITIEDYDGLIFTRLINKNEIHND